MKSASFYWNNKWFLTLCAGLLMGLSWPPLSFPFLVFPAFILLFRIIDLCGSAREAAYWTYPAFLVWNIITTYWLVMATVAGGIAAILANAAVMTLPVMLQQRAQHHLKRPWVIALLQSAFWISYEYLHHQWDLAWPWLAIGNAWSNVPVLVQYISATGYLGISFWVVLSCSLLYQYFKFKQKNIGLSAAAVTLLFPLISLLQLTVSAPIEENSEGSNSHIEAVVVQPNFDTYDDFGGYEDAFEALDVLLRLSESVRTDSTDLILWPENGIRSTIYSEKVNSQTADAIKKQMSNISESWNVPIIAGAVYLKYYSQDRAPALSRSGGINPYLYYNAALAFYPDKKYQVYKKHNLVPIVERIPFVHMLHAVDLFGWVDWTRYQGYGKGYEADPFTIGRTSTPALVCYDSVFPGWVRKYVQQGAGFISIITNDGWWGNTSGHSQHFAYARLRALEFRRWVLRSANNGISGVVAPDGSIKVKTEYWTQAAFKYSIPVKNEMTIYALYGDWLPVLMLLLSATGILYFWIPSRNQEE